MNKIYGIQKKKKKINVMNLQKKKKGGDENKAHIFSKVIVGEVPTKCLL